MAENKLNDMIGVSLEKIKELAGTETVIGNPIYTPNGTLILPVSKVSMGFASGGIDYGQKKAEEGKEIFFVPMEDFLERIGVSEELDPPSIQGKI